MFEQKVRVTVVATGLGSKAAKQRPPMLKPVEGIGLRTGTDNVLINVMSSESGDVSLPPVFHGRARNAAVEAMTSSGMDKYDIPAFLRKQAD